ncbi:MAG: HD domain-containing protein [Candidatus Omnitrophica bacterium]|nr:HD domain-containing protein [Candidatus Omnitrophota bacterium]
MRAGVIDIGSRSIKLVIAESGESDIIVLESLKNVVPIANDTFLKNQISQATINQTVTVLEKYQQILKDYDVPTVSVIATTAVREARNRDIFVDTMRRKTGLDIEILTVGDIVYYIDAYLAHRLKDTYPIHEKNLFIAELGSGNLDISVMKRGFTLMNMGLPLGTLRLKQLMSSFSGSLAETFEAVTEYIANEFSYLERSIPRTNIDDIILIDENYSSYLHNIIPDITKDEKFYQLSIENSQNMLKQVADKTPREIARAFKVPLDVADTIIAYAIILNIFFTLTQNKSLYVLETSLSEALLANILLELELAKKYDRLNQLTSVARSICQKYRVDLPHAEYVARMSAVLFENLHAQLGLDKASLQYLTLAAYLHDIGMFIHNRAHHKHSEYIITSLNLSRLTAAEITIIACIARYHRKAIPSESHLTYASLPVDKKILVQKLSALLRIANALDRSHKQKFKKLEIKTKPNHDIHLIAQSQESNCILEQNDFRDKKGLFEEITGNRISLLTQG